MTPRERVLNVLRGESTDRIPFVIWNNKLPGGDVERDLMAQELCVFVKTTAYQIHHEGVTVERQNYEEADGSPRVRVVYHTPAGDLTEVQHHMPGTVWTEKHIFEKPEDYDAVEALLQSCRYVPCYDKFAQDDKAYGDQSIGRPGTLHAPFHYVMNHIMGMTTFWDQWFENEERVRRVIELLSANSIAQVRVLAESPIHYAVVDGNTQASIIGPDRYREFHMTFIEEASSILHKAGKLVAAHMDGDNALLAPLIGETPLDVIESFSPPPECDLGLTDALQAWPGKAIICNYPPSRHLCDEVEVRRIAEALLKEGADSGRFMMGVMEDIPTYEHVVMLAKMTREWRS